MVIEIDPSLSGEEARNAALQQLADGATRLVDAAIALSLTLPGDDGNQRVVQACQLIAEQFPPPEDSDCPLSSHLYYHLPEIEAAIQTDWSARLFHQD